MNGTLPKIATASIYETSSTWWCIEPVGMATIQPTKIHHLRCLYIGHALDSKHIELSQFFAKIIILTDVLCLGLPQVIQAAELLDLVNEISHFLLFFFVDYNSRTGYFTPCTIRHRACISSYNFKSARFVHKLISTTQGGLIVS